MSDKIKSFEDIEKRLNSYIEYHESLLGAWDKVERVSKKDGTDFAILSKNFVNVDFSIPYHLSNTVDKRARVYARTSGQYNEDHFDIFVTCDESYEGEKFYNYGSTPYRQLTADEVAEKIESQKKYHAVQVEDLKKQLSDARLYFDQVKAHTDALKSIINGLHAIKGGYSSSLGYALKDYVENFYYTR